MQFFISLSIAMLAGLLVSRLAKLLKLPAVTAYLVAGILVGPFLIGAIDLSGLGVDTGASNVYSNNASPIWPLNDLLPS